MLRRPYCRLEVALLALCLALAFLLFTSRNAFAQDWTLNQTDLVGPAGSELYGETVNVLPKGNIVVLDANFDKDGIKDAGAVYLYSGTTLALISQLTGSQQNDRIGYGGVLILENSDFVISSPFWANGAISVARAVTHIDGVTELAGEVSAANSPVGTTATPTHTPTLTPITTPGTGSATATPTATPTATGTPATATPGEINYLPNVQNKP